MKNNSLILFLLLVVVLQSCKKENRINKEMEGTWNLTEYKRAGDYVKSDFSEDKMSIEFKRYKKAYTRTMQGIFIIDYSDPVKVDVRDTFEYQLKNDEFDVTDVITKNTKLKPFLKNRFIIKDYKDDKLKLVRKDSTDLYIKATK